MDCDDTVGPFIGWNYWPDVRPIIIIGLMYRRADVHGWYVSEWPRGRLCPPEKAHVFREEHLMNICSPGPNGSEIEFLVRRTWLGLEVL